MAHSPSSGDGPPQRETSIRRGIEVLLSLVSDEALGAGGLGVKQIAEQLGREKSQVSRAPTALADYGLVDRTADATYRLGWRLQRNWQARGHAPTARDRRAGCP